jgi:hypothetical protein
MEDEKQLKTIEEELKLLKGELKQSLVSVRDYLLNMELPATEFSTIMAALGDTGEHTMELKGTFQLPPDNQAQEEPEPEPVSEDKEDDFNTGDKKESHLGTHVHDDEESELLLEEEEELPEDEEEIPEEPEEEIEEEPEMVEDIFREEPFMPDAELPMEELPVDYPRPDNALGQSVPKVNLLANLISWISVARRDIGDDQLATFLEVYGISGYLSPEMKDVILHLANITSEKPGENNTAEIWSNSMLSLHGILTGGDVPLNPVKPQWGGLTEEETESLDEETGETEEPEEQPVKLKLVFPNGDGKGKEYCIDLTPETKNYEPEL